jgi:predicted secreted protein
MMIIISLQQIINKRISFLKEQINPQNKAEVSKTFQIQRDAIRSVDDDIEQVESLIMQKKALLKNNKNVMIQICCLRSLMAWNGIASAANSKILLKRNNNEKQRQHIVVVGYCSICGKKLKKFGRTTQNPLTCWQCMIVNLDS